MTDSKSQNGGATDSLQDRFNGGASDVNAIFITNLQWWTTDEDLESECSRYGQVANIKFLDDRSCGKSRGMAVVEFLNPQAAQTCLETMNGKMIHGRPCRIQRQMQQYRPTGAVPMGGRGGGPTMMDASMIGLPPPWAPMNGMGPSQGQMMMGMGIPSSQGPFPRPPPPPS